MSKLRRILQDPLTGYLWEKVVLPLISIFTNNGNTTSTENTSSEQIESPKNIKTGTLPTKKEGEPMPPKYFTLSEFQCKHCGQLPPKGINPVLLEKLEKLREHIGAPVYITSGYRCPTHNKAVGGVSNSQHVFGKAADIYTDALTVEQLAALCKEIGFDGIGTYPEDGFVHVDVRDDGNSPGQYLW